MKKLLFGVLLCSSLLVCGCKWFSSSSDSKTKTITVDVNHPGRAYLVKVNYSPYYSIAAAESGKVESTKARQAVGSAAYNINEAFNQRVIASLKNNSSRAASSFKDQVVTQTPQTLNISVGNTKSFSSLTSTKDSSILEGVSGTVNATCYYAGEHCYVFGDNSEKNGAKKSKGIDLNYSNDETKNSFVLIGKIFDSCYGLETQIIGDPLYSQYNEAFTRCNNKVIILVSDLYGDAYKDQDSGVAGYFANADLFSQTFLDENINVDRWGNTLSTTDSNYIHSNECEMFYIDSCFLTNAPENVYSTLVHEFNHMINYVIKTIKFMGNHNISINNYGSYLCDSWFTEMLAMTTEDMFIDFLKTPETYSPIARLAYFDLFYHYGFRNWDSFTVTEYPKLDSLYVSYANTYAFGAFLARNFGGTNLIKEIAQNDYINEDAITQALNTLYPGQGYNYKYAVEKFPLVILNTASPSSAQLSATGENQYYSLNRGIKINNNDKLFFSPVNIGRFTYDDGNYISPKIYKGSEEVLIGANGFTIHYIGSNLKSFEFTANTSNKLGYFLVKD